MATTLGGKRLPMKRIAMHLLPSADSRFASQEDAVLFERYPQSQTLSCSSGTALQTYHTTIQTYSTTLHTYPITLQTYRTHSTILP